MLIDTVIVDVVEEGMMVVLLLQCMLLIIYYIPLAEDLNFVGKTSFSHFLEINVL